MFKLISGNEKQRKSEVKSFAKKRGYVFNEGDWILNKYLHESFHKKGEFGNKLDYFFQFNMDSNLFEFMDSRYFEHFFAGIPRTAFYRRQSVLFVDLRQYGLNFPDFFINTKGLINSYFCKDVCGYNTVNVEGHKLFSKRFILRGFEKKAIRSIFNSDVLNFFEKKKGRFTLEVKNNQLIFYTSWRRINLQKDFDKFSKDFLDIIEVFKKF
ncbi:MAG: hypothetical protein KC550_05675 [Nanoarchaeota archaeon]|nr:hypothetical protein [Nanoarchaeota archaeon]